MNGGQIRECTAYAEKNGFRVVKHYIDRAVSAKTDNRPQFQQMIKDSERGIFDVIIVWKLDCFARNRYDSARYKTQLKRNGVKLVSATEVISACPEGIILESVLEGYAEYYSADLSEKVVLGVRRTCRGEPPPSCYARPFCRLKAPLGLSLLRSAAQTRTFENTLISAACKKKQGKL